MKLLTRQHSQQFENFGFGFGVYILQPGCVSYELLEFLLSNRDIHLGFRFSGDGTYRNKFSKNGIISPECRDKTVGNCACMNYLNSQRVVFDQVKARQHGMVNRQHSFRNWEVNVKDFARSDVFYVLADAFFHHIKTYQKLSSNPQKQAMQRDRLSSSFAFFVHAVLIGSKGNGYCYCNYGTYRSDPIRPFRSAHFATVFPHCAPRNPKCEGKAKQGDYRRNKNKCQSYAQNHYSPNLSWRNRNTQSIGGGK